METLKPRDVFCAFFFSMPFCTHISLCYILMIANNSESKTFFKNVFVSICCFACIYVYVLLHVCLLPTETSVAGFLGAGVKRNLWAACGSWESNPMEEQPMLLTEEPFLSFPQTLCKVLIVPSLISRLSIFGFAVIKGKLHSGKSV